MKRAIATAVCMLLAATLAFGAPSMYQDFEKSWDLEKIGWSLSGDGWASIRSLEGAQRLTMTFNSREYDVIRPYLRIQSGTGTVWFDEVKMEGLDVANAGFEEHDGDRLTGWIQDDIRRTIGWDGDHGFGRGCARIHKTYPEGHRRIYQDVPCEPNTEYRLEVWCDSRDLDGNVYAEVYGVSNGEYASQLGTTQRIQRRSDRYGDRALELHPRGDEVAVTHPASGQAGRLASVALEAQMQGLAEGALTLAVVDAADGETLASTSRTADEPAGGWVPLSLNFAAPADARPEVRIAVEGRGSVRVDNIRTGDVQLPVPPRQITPIDLTAGVVPGEIVVEGADADGALLSRAIATVRDGLAELDAEGAPAPIEVTVTGGGVQWPESESYRVEIDADGARITAATETGATWGLMTLLDLAEAGGGLVGQCEIVDAPAMPFRGTYRGGMPSGAGAAEWGRRLMRLKMNALVMEDGVWFDLDEENNRERAVAAFEELRAWGVEPIPELQSLGHAGNQLSRNPNVVEGEWQRDEELVLTGTEPMALEHNNVLRTEATDIVITSADGETTYEEGPDYEVIDGELNYPYEADAEPFSVRRIAQGRIPDGATVLASYDHAIKMGSRNIPYCPSEPAVYDIMFPAIENTITYLQPRWLHIGHDEPRIVNSDSRCLKRDMTGGELLAEDLVKLNDYAHSIDPDVQLMMWADALNPYHNGTWFSDEHEEELNLVPKDIIQNVWFYGAETPLTRGRYSFQHFDRYGFTVTGSPWDNLVCCHNWGVVAGEARRGDIDCLGLLYTSWSNKWAGLETLAAVAWNPPES